jgi:hypothetical protein
LRSRGLNELQARVRIALHLEVVRALAVRLAELRELVEAALVTTARGQGFDLTPFESARFYETGELPERVERAGREWGRRWRAKRRKNPARARMKP